MRDGKSSERRCSVNTMILNVVGDYVCLVIIAVVAAIIMTAISSAFFSYLLKKVCSGLQALFSEFGDDA